MFSSTIVSLALAASALANVFITNPVSGSVLTAGQAASLTWQDDGESPSLSEWGLATFAIYVGNAIQQTPLQTIATYINVSSVSSLQITPDPSIGPNSDEYFIRVTSQSYKDPSSPQYYEEAFSAKFTLAGMSGSFNSSLQAEIDGQSTAPIGGTTSASAATPATATATTGTQTMTTVVTSAKSSASSSSSASATTSATAGSTNGAGKPVIATGFVVLVTAFIGASLF